MEIPGFTATGTSFADAAPLPAAGRIATVDVQTVPAGSGVILPGYVDGVTGNQLYVIRNSSASQALLIYPQAGGTIDGATTPYTLGTQTMTEFYAFSPLDWVHK